MEPIRIDAPRTGPAWIFFAVGSSALLWRAIGWEDQSRFAWSVRIGVAVIASVIVLASLLGGRETPPLMRVDDTGIEIHSPGIDAQDRETRAPVNEHVRWEDVRSVELDTLRRGLYVLHHVVLHVALRDPIRVRVGSASLRVVDAIRRELDARFARTTTVTAPYTRERPIPSLRDQPFRPYANIASMLLLLGMAAHFNAQIPFWFSLLLMGIGFFFPARDALRERGTELTQDALVRRWRGRTTRIRWGDATLQIGSSTIVVTSGTDSIPITVERYADPDELTSWIRNRISDSAVQPLHVGGDDVT